VAEYNRAKREATHVIAEEQRRSFESMAEQLDINTDLFRLTKASTDQDKADTMVKEYAAVSRVARRREYREVKKEARAALRKKCPCPPMCKEFTRGQLKGALRKLKKREEPRSGWHPQRNAEEPSLLRREHHDLPLQ
jgi:hypothetical protein